MNSISSRANYALPESRPKRGLQRLLAAIVAVFLAMAGVVTTAGAATAAPSANQGFSLEVVNKDNSTLDPVVFEAGKEYAFLLDYDLLHITPDTRVATVKIPTWIQFDAKDLDMSGNSIFDSVERVGDELRITFVDPESLEEGENGVEFAGLFKLMFKVDLVEDSQLNEISWEHGTNGETIEVVIKKEGEEESTFDYNISKTLKDVDLNGLLTVDPDAENSVTLSEENLVKLLAKEFTYELKVESKDGIELNYFINDRLGSELKFVDENVVSATLETWDANGLNKQGPDSFADFSHQVDGNDLQIDVTQQIDKRARLIFEVNAQIDPTKVDELLKDLNAQYDESSFLEGGRYEISLTNKAFFNGTAEEDSDSDTAIIGGQRPAAPGIDIENRFKKTNDFDGPKIVEVEESLPSEDATRTLKEPEDVTYSLAVNLSGLKPETNEKQELISDVIVTDTLPDSISWNGAPTLKVQGDQGLEDGPELKEASGVGALKEFEYRFDGQKFEVNLGQNYVHYVVETPAKINSLINRKKPVSKIYESYTETNTATIKFDVKYKNTTVTDEDASDVILEVDIPGDPDTEIEESSAFDKKGPSGAVTVKPGEAAEIKFVFTGNRVDFKNSTITDFVDNKVFGTPEQYLKTLKVAGNVNEVGVNNDYFVIEPTTDGDFTIKVKSDDKTISDLKLDGSDKFSLEITLTTLPIVGKGSLWITNSAQLAGGFGEHIVTSSTNAVGTSRGNEIEVRKTVWDEASESWQSNVKAPLTDAEGELVNHTFVYRIQFYAHGLMGNRYFNDLEDLLPAGMEFKGFVENVNGDLRGESISTDDGKLTATHKDGQIVMSAPNGITGDKPVDFLFRVEVSDFTEDTPIVNKVGRSNATIVPTNDYPLSISKLDSEEPADVIINDPESEFILLDDKGEEVVKGRTYFVQDGMIVWKDGNSVKSPTVKQHGTYILREVTPPKGYEDPEVPLEIEIIVGENDAIVEASFENDPIPAYAVGDFTWVDTNRNGIQDGDEPVLEDVTVKITDENGEVVKDIFGDIVEAVKTDEKGFYLFDQLPEGKYKVHFALTDEQKEQYSFTQQVKDNLATDSNADTASDNYGWSVLFELGDKNENVISQKEYKQIVGEDGQTFEARKGIDPTWDAGVITKKVSVGDYVWFDKNGNGIQDEEGTGIDGVVLKLWKVVGDKVTPVEVDGQQLTEITAEGGEYLFENLPALKAGEKYRVTIDYDHESTISALEPYVPTTPGAGEDREADSSTDFSDSIIDLVADGTHDPSLDFGFVLQSVTVGDYVWFDKDRDGRQDDGERGIKDVLLKIFGPDGELVTEDVFGNEVEPQRTDENGKYLFPHLPVLKEGESYKVVIDREDEKTQGALELYAPTTSNEGDREGDSDTWEAKSQGLTKDGQEDLTLDFGFVVKSYAIGDVVWIDSNRDGLQDEGEKPLEGVAVTLYRVVDGEDVKVTEDIAGDEFGDVETNSEGRYIFDNLPAGTYKVHFELTEAQKNTFSFTIADAKTEVEGVVADEVDSDADQKTGWTIQVVLDDSNEALTKEYDIEGGFKATQGIDPTWDAGVIYKKVSVGDYVWYDFNADGIQDKDEAGIDGVVLKLWKVVGDEVTPVEVDGQQLTEITAEGGEYLFENLPALKAGEKYRVTIDYDHESTISALEPYVPTTPGAGEDREVDSSTDFSDSIIDLVVDGTHDPSLDFGFVLKKVSVGDFVWFDKNRDGAQDEGEPGIPGVVLELVGPDGKPVTDVFGEPVDRVTTGENGEYTFENLPVLKGEEVYTVVIVEEDPSTVEALKPYVPTYEEGAERDKDSSTWESESLTLTEDGERDDTLDFGFILKSYGIGDVVWIDSNNNGLQDYETEEPLSGVTVTLFRVLEDGTLEVVTEDIDGDVVEPQVTDEDGWYMFDYLPAGNYQVQFELTDEQATKYIFTSYVSGDDDSIDSNANPTTGFTDVIALNDDNENLDLEYLEGDFGASEGIDPTWDAGVVVKTYAIGDIVWVDTNRDGIQGETEVLEGVTVTLLNDKGDVITSTKTDKNGRYIFDVLPAGDYQVKFELTKEQAAKYKFTSVNSGKDAKADSDADLGTGLTKVFKLDDNSAGLTTDYKDQTFEANQGIDPTWDAGVVLKSVSVGDFVWEDKDGNGRQDKGEPGIPGVVLEVTGPDGKPVTDVYGNPVKPATTDKDGKYTFENLPVLEPGQCYTVTINQKESAKALEKYLPTKSGAGDRGGDSSTWTVCSEGLTEDGERDDTLDFGFVLNPEFLAVTGTNLLVPVSVATLALGAGAYLVLRNRKTGSRRA